MKLRFGVGSKEARKEGKKNGDIDALVDARPALKNQIVRLCFKNVQKVHILFIKKNSLAS